MNKKKIPVVMREFQQGKLHHGSKRGKIVTDPKIAMAIAMREAGMPRKASSKRR